MFEEKDNKLDKETIVFVALSGGVDSSVVLHMLKEKYDNVRGISHIVWPESLCCTTECLDSCELQCQREDVPYQSIEAVQEFSEKVIDFFAASYFAGRTPNPCVLCNQQVRFDFMVREFFKINGLPPDTKYKLATGHYARIEEKDGHFFLKKGLDSKKDQAYMLYRLSQEQLAHALFPLGELKKEDVRNLAAQWHLSSAKKADSVDACFAGGDYRQFLVDYTGRQPQKGNFVDSQNNILGEHEGYPFYTRGQRRGLGLSGGPWYVIDVRPQRNEVVLGKREELLLTEFYVDNLVWHVPNKNEGEAMVQVRYHSAEIPCRIEKIGEDLLAVKLATPSAEIAPGQSAVFYDGDYVLGGGYIKLERN